jgi:23S rRNA pseudouridine1911/1915/1917 synthase
VTLEQAVRTYLDGTDPARVYLGIVHRLDRPTSGVLIWAKTRKAAHRLSRQFETRLAVKEYWAIVAGLVDRAQTPSLITHSSTAYEALPRETWLDWVTRPDRAGKVEIVSRLTQGSREAITEVALGPGGNVPNGCAWLRMWPRTGRAHQLRVQAAGRGIPILGDSTYGSDRQFGPVHTIALHAYRLQVAHPISGVALDLTAPAPPEWNSAGIILPEIGRSD